ncbi:MAG: T9SS type A sorting domain-containing protein [Bacteroidia bacterium]
MKKLLLSVLTLSSLSAFPQWVNTTNYSAKDIYSAFGKVLESDVNSNGLTASTDEGVTWNTSNTGIPSNGVNFGTYGSSTLYAFRDNNIYQTTNGSNWSVMTSAATSTDVIKSMTVLNGTVLAVSNPVSGSGFKIWSLNSGSWSLRASQTTSLATYMRNLNGQLWVGTSNNCVAKSSDAGMTFTNSSTGMTVSSSVERYMECLGATSTALFAGSHMGKIYRSTDNGSTWSIVYNIGNGTSTIDINEFYTAPNGSILVACDSGFVYSVDNGTNWTKYNTGLSYPAGENMLTHITMSPNYILATTKRSNGSVVRLPIASTAIGIKESSLPQVESKVFPNPAHQMATIEATALIYDDNCDVKLHDALGREAGSYTMSQGRVKLDLSAFSQGLYTYTIYNHKAIISKGKLMVN